MANIDTVLFEYFNTLKRSMQTQPLILGGVGGSSGGSGGPAGGFIGTLPQTRVSYDESEFALITTSGTGSLLDNLNHIRFRLEDMEDIIINKITVSGVAPSFPNINDLWVDTN